MNEGQSNAYLKKVEALRACGSELLNWEEAIATPDFKEYGMNRGLRLEFYVGDVLHFMPLNKAVFFTSTFKSGGNTYKVLKTLCVITHDGVDTVREVPAAIFCRIPYLEKEQEILWKGNAFGKQIADAEADYLRLKICCETGDVLVTWKSGKDGAEKLHTDRWYTDKDTDERVCVHDSEDLPESERVSLVCYKFAPVA